MAGNPDNQRDIILIIIQARFQDKINYFVSNQDFRTWGHGFIQSGFQDNILFNQDFRILFIQSGFQNTIYSVRISGQLHL